MLRFRATLRSDSRRRVYLPLPSEPEVRHLVGTVNGMRYRGAVESIDGTPALVLGPAWRRGCGLEPGDRVRVELEPEGPQRRDLAPDLAAALEASPAAAAFWDELAQFYRRAANAAAARAAQTGGTVAVGCDRLKLNGKEEVDLTTCGEDAMHEPLRVDRCLKRPVFVTRRGDFDAAPRDR